MKHEILNDRGCERMREDEIRPDRFKEIQARYIEEDINWLIKRKSEFVFVSCPACSFADARPVFEKNGLKYVECASCEVVYVNPRPAAKLLGEFYASSKNYEFWNKYIFPASEKTRSEKIFAPRAERLAELCKRHNVPVDTLLEVGGGFGTFAEAMRRLELFKRIVVIEPVPELALTCRERGIEVINRPIEQVGEGELTASVVASFEVIEHLYSPREYIKKCVGFLEPGGMLVLSCPNVKGFDFQVLGIKSDGYDHEHINYFHPAALSSLVAGCGLEVLEVLTPGKLDAELVRKQLLAGKCNVAVGRFLEQILVEEWERLGQAFQDFLVSQNLSSHMWLVARKER